MSFVRAPIVIGASISGILALIALVEALRSSPRWDDHLISATGVLGGALFLSFTSWLVTAACPGPSVSKRARLVRTLALVALGLLTFIAISVAVFLNDMSFL